MCCVWKDGNEYKILVGEYGRELRGNGRRRQENNIKIILNIRMWMCELTAAASEQEGLL